MSTYEFVSPEASKLWSAAGLSLIKAEEAERAGRLLDAVELTSLALTRRRRGLEMEAVELRKFSQRARRAGLS